MKTDLKAAAKRLEEIKQQLDAYKKGLITYDREHVLQLQAERLSLGDNPNTPSQPAKITCNDIPEAVAKVRALTAAFQKTGRDLLTISEALDRITRSYTAFGSFWLLVNAAGNYRPSLLRAPERAYNRNEPVYLPDHRQVTREVYYAELDFLAIAYDLAQEQRGDSRRAYRS